MGDRSMSAAEKTALKKRQERERQLAEQPPGFEKKKKDGDCGGCKDEEDK